MEFTSEGFLIAVLGILPGFVASWVRALISNEPGDVEVEKWIAGSIVASIAFNAFLATVFVVLVLPIDFNETVSDLVEQLTCLRLSTLLWYGLGLYGIATALGAFQALVPSLHLGAIAHRLRLTPVSPVPNVFCDTLDRVFRTRANLKLRGKPTQMVPWLRLQRDGVIVVGRLDHSSIRFDVDKPIEAFLSPASVITDSGATRICPPGGLYIRVLANDVVEIVSASASTDPEGLAS